MLSFRWAVVVVLTLAVGPSFGHLNLYLTNAEVRRILGLQAELFYVREGVVNDYAMSWTVPVAADVHALLFTWRATGGRPLLYNMAVWAGETKLSDVDGESHTQHDASDHRKVGSRLKDELSIVGGETARGDAPPPGIALAPPFVNISLTGAVPPEPETFALHLPCTGAVSAEVEVTLNINVTAPSPNLLPTVLYFRRRKICLKGQSAESFAPHQDPIEEGTVVQGLGPLSLGVAGAAGSAVVVCSIAVAACFRRLAAAGKRHQDQSTAFGPDHKVRSETSSTLLSPSSTTVYCPSSSVFSPSVPTLSGVSVSSSGQFGTLPPDASSTHCYSLPVDPPSLYPPSTITISPPQSVGGVCTLPRAQGKRLWIKDGDSLLQDCSSTSFQLDGLREVMIDPSLVELHEGLRHLQVDRRRVLVSAVMLQGRYGLLCSGLLLAGSQPDTKVLIKTLAPNAPPSETASLLSVASRLSRVQHRALLAVAAVALCPASPPLVIFPDLGFQNLKTCLRARSSHLTPDDLQQMALQAAQGLAHLHACNLMHGDLAARNCVVTDQYQLRVTDSALSADLFPDDYQPLLSGGGVNQGAPLPVAWMALETLSGQTADLPSDVWSWGVLAWELSTLCQQPYKDLSPTHLTEYLRDGYRLAQPATCPDVLYQLMAFCWAINPQHRPRAALLVDYLTGLTQSGGTPPLQPASSSSSASGGSDFETANHIPASSFLYRTSGELKNPNSTPDTRLRPSTHGLPKDLNPEAEQGSLFSPPLGSLSAMPGLPTVEEYCGTSSSQSQYSSPVPSSDDAPPGLSHFPSTVYSTPTSLAGDLPWKLPLRKPTQNQAKTPQKGTQTGILQQKSPPREGSDAVPPPLPPANSALKKSRALRPQQPVPAVGLL